MFNELLVIGNLTRDIELKYLPSGSAIAKGAIATTHKYKQQDGTQKEEVMFMDFAVFGKGGEVLNQYVKKGSKVFLRGRVIFEQWQDNQGQNRSRHTLRVEDFKFLDSKTEQGYQPQQNNDYGIHMQSEQYNQNAYNNHMQKDQHIDINNDEIPF